MIGHEGFISEKDSILYPFFLSYDTDSDHRDYFIDNANEASKKSGLPKGVICDSIRFV